MSRAFVNEDSAANQADTPVERQVSEQPNYVTALGLEQLQAKVAELQRLHSQEAARKPFERFAEETARPRPRA